VIVVARASFLLSLLFLAAVEAAGAQARPDSAAADHVNRTGTWSASNSNGLVLMGTWTAVLDLKTGTVTGTWTLIDAQNKAVGNGSWSAAKAPNGWTGAWRALVAGRSGEFSGTWASRVDLKADAGFADLFEKAALDAVSGTWGSGTYSGAWSIRAAKG
jgi:hypothetical protein